VRKLLRVLVTSSRSPHALAAIRSFGEKGFEVTAGDNTRLSPGMYSRYAARRLLYPSATEKPVAFIEALLEELRRTPYDLLFPTFEDIFVISRQRERFSELVRHLVPPYDRMMAVHNKSSLAELCTVHDVPAPHTATPASLDDLEPIAADLDYPVILKLAEGNNSLGLSQARNPQELCKRYRKLVRFFSLEPGRFSLIQKKVEGDLIFSLFLADRGNVVGQLIYKPIRMFPEGGGTAFYRESIRHEQAEQIAADFIEKLGWHGFIGFDFMIERGTGVPYLLDANPRPSPAYNTGLASGVDFTQQFVDMAQEKKPAVMLKPTEGVRSKTLFVEIIWFGFQFLPGKGYFKRVRDAMSVFKKRVFVNDVHRSDDRLPSLVLAIFVWYFLFVINVIKPKRGGFMFGCNYDRAIADKSMASDFGSTDDRTETP